MPPRFAKSKVYALRVAKGFVLLLAAVVALVGLAVPAVNLPFARRLIASKVNALLAATFEGKIVIESIGHLDPFGAGGVRATVRDPAGRLVLRVDGASARLDTVRLVRSLMHGDSIEIALPTARVDHVDLSLDGDRTGALRLVRAFSPRAPEKPIPAPETPGAPVVLSIPDAWLGQAWIHGLPPGAPLIDADVRSASAAFSMIPQAIEVTVRSGRLVGRAVPVGANPNGEVTAHLVIPTSRPLRLDAAFNGDVGGLSSTARARLDGEWLDATVTAEAARGARRTLLPDLELDAPLSLRVSAKGPLAKLGVEGQGTLGQGHVDIDGTVSLDPVVRGNALVRVSHADLRALSPGLPETDLAATADATFDVLNGVPRAHFRARTSPASVGSGRVPSLGVVGDYADGRLYAKILAEDRGTHAVAGVCLRRDTGDAVLDADVTASVTDIGRLPALPAGTKGAAVVFAYGMVNLTRKTVRGHVVVNGTDLAVPGFTVHRLFADARAEGPLERPRLDATVNGVGLALGDRAFESATLHAVGTPARADVTAQVRGAASEPSLRATAQVSIGSAIELRRIGAQVDREGRAVFAGADLVRIQGGAVRVDRAVVVGLGAPLHADATLRANELRIRIDSRQIDVARVARALSLRAHGLRGTIDADVDLVARPSGAQGHARIDATGVHFRQGGDASGHVDVTVEGDRVKGNVDGVWCGSHLVAKTDDLRLGGRPTDLASWARAYGGVSLTAELDLARLRETVPDRYLPFEQMAGALIATATLSRASPGATPDGSLSVHTQDFEISKKGEELEPSDGTRVRNAPAWRLSGLDFDLDLASDRAKDRLTVHGVVRDPHGVLADVAIESKSVGPEQVGDGAKLRRFLETNPLSVSFKVPARKLAELPDAVGRTSMDGVLSLDGTAKGTLLDPDVALIATLADFRPQKRKSSPLVGARLEAKYDGRAAKIDVDVERGGKRALGASLLGHLTTRDLLDKGGDAPWDGTLRARLDALPMESIPQLAEERLSGDVTGDLEVRAGTDGAPHAHLELSSSAFGVGKRKNNRAAVKLDVQERTVQAAVRVDQPDGMFASEGSVGIEWPKLLTPARRGPLPPPEPAQVDVRAKNFRISPLRPFLRSVVSQLDGRVDANFHIDVPRGGHKTSARGQVVVRDGVFELPNVGEEFQAVRARAAFAENGVVTIDDVYARGTTGSVSGKAVVRLDGLAFSSATGDFQIPQSGSLPISMEGQTLADAWGKFHAEATRTPSTGAVDVKVDIPVAGVRLPDKSTRSLQSLEPADRVRIGVHRARRQFEVLRDSTVAAADATPSAGVHVAVHLKDVEVRRGTDLRVRLDGNPTVVTGKGAGVYGQIQLRDGFLEVQGKRFEIERGTITFNGKPDNPEVVVTAGWNAPEGSRVYADFIGPLQTGKVTLRSEPAHTKTEILSLILFGTTNGSSPPAAPGTTAADSGAQNAAGLGGSYAAQGLNRALDDLTGLDITARVDTSDSVNPRPELEMRIARDISVALAHVIGVPPPGAQPDRNFAMVDWRFRRNWSVETTFGDAGSTSVDLIWQYRY